MKITQQRAYDIYTLLVVAAILILGGYVILNADVISSVINPK